MFLIITLFTISIYSISIINKTKFNILINDLSLISPTEANTLYSLFSKLTTTDPTRNIDILNKIYIRLHTYYDDLFFKYEGTIKNRNILMKKEEISISSKIPNQMSLTIHSFEDKKHLLHFKLEKIANECRKLQSDYTTLLNKYQEDANIYISKLKDSLKCLQNSFIHITCPNPKKTYKGCRLLQGIKNNINLLTSTSRDLLSLAFYRSIPDLSVNHGILESGDLKYKVPCNLFLTEINVFEMKLKELPNDLSRLTEETFTSSCLNEKEFLNRQLDNINTGIEQLRRERSRQVYLSGETETKINDEADQNDTEYFKSELLKIEDLLYFVRKMTSSQITDNPLVSANCQMSSWTLSPCSKECGDYGVFNASRSLISDDANLINYCSKQFPLIKPNIPCNRYKCLSKCPVTKWTQWSDCVFTGCLGTNGIGYSIRTRDVLTTDDLPEDSACDYISLYETKECTISTNKMCLTTRQKEDNCRYSEWSNWSPVCSRSCGPAGVFKRHRFPLSEGGPCPDLYDEKECNRQVDCEKEGLIKPIISNEHLAFILDTSVSTEDLKILTLFIQNLIKKLSNSIRLSIVVFASTSKVLFTEETPTSLLSKLKRISSSMGIGRNIHFGLSRGLHLESVSKYILITNGMPSSNNLVKEVLANSHHQELYIFAIGSRHRFNHKEMDKYFKPKYIKYIHDYTILNTYTLKFLSAISNMKK